MREHSSSIFCSLISFVQNKCRIFKKSDHSNSGTVTVLIVAEHNDDVHDDGNSQNQNPFCFPILFALICFPHFCPEQTQFQLTDTLVLEIIENYEGEKKSFDAMT